MYFVPVLTDGQMKEIDNIFTGAPIVDMSSPEHEMEEPQFELAEAVVNWIHSQKSGCSVVNKFLVVSFYLKTVRNYSMIL